MSLVTPPSTVRPVVQITTHGHTVRRYGAIGDPGALDFAIIKGANFDLRLTWIDATVETPVPLASGAATLTVRDEPGGVIRCQLTSPTAIELSDDTPNIRVRLTAAQTAALSGWLAAPYDLLVTDATGTVAHVLTGLCVLRSTV